MNADDQSGPTAALVDRVNDAIRENPLAAGLIGAGAVWMLFGAKGLGVVGSLAKGAVGKASDVSNLTGSVAAYAGGAALGAASKASNVVTDASSGFVNRVTSFVPDASIGDTTRRATDAVASSGSEYSAAIRSRLSESMERQPLLIGAIGLAVGAGIASTFATTTVESELMGSKGAAVKEKISEIVDETSRHGNQVISDVRTEATRQGLTMEGARGVASKIKNIAAASKEAVGNRLK